MLIKYADIMKLKMPLIVWDPYKNCVIIKLDSLLQKGNENMQADEFLRYFPNPFRVDRTLLPEVQEQFTSFFSQARIDQYAIFIDDNSLLICASCMFVV